MPVQRITDQQRAQYYAIMSEYEPKLREFADQLFVKENELQALKHAVQPDVNAVRATAEEIVKLRNQRRALKRTIDARLEKECGIKRPQKPIPGVDIPYRPFRGHHGPRGMHGPMGPGSAPHGPHHEM